MKLVTSISTLKRFVVKAKRRGKRISFVPTMGAFHAGHISLIRAAGKEGGIVIVSIFVNPIQFGPAEDYREYPRQLLYDKRLAEENGVDILFCPNADEMYPEGYSTYVEEESLSRVMCGRQRPGHFRGVTTVVLKLFNIVQPDTAFFGQKDYQQALIIKKMVKDLNLSVRIKVLPIVRDRDGLALSSRNQYLSEDERRKALLIYQMLKKRKRAKSLNIDYFVMADRDTLRPIKRVKPGKTLIAVAATVGKTRLIDNILL